jgi:hypothetical protein
MDKPLLNNKDEFPSEEVLKKILGKTFKYYQKLETILTNELSLTYEWRYYNDSKAWLCKVAHKKKTIFWLSAWDGFFKTSFFFLERHLEGIMKLEISANNFILEKEWGKMIPFIFEIKNEKIIKDLLKMVEYKKSSK